jgi:hypothetical protein
MRWELGELRRDFVQSEADALGEDDKRDSSQYGAVVSALASAAALGSNKAAIFIESQR